MALALATVSSLALRAPAVRMAVDIPKPAMSAESIGNYGFDPLNLGTGVRALFTAGHRSALSPVFARTHTRWASLCSLIHATHPMPRTDETFMPFREAEIKHGRLAMLAAVAWPLQEIFHPLLVDAARETNALAPFFVRDVLAETAGKSPSLLLLHQRKRNSPKLR